MRGGWVNLNIKVFNKQHRLFDSEVPLTPHYAYSNRYNQLKTL